MSKNIDGHLRSVSKQVEDKGKISEHFGRSCQLFNNSLENFRRVVSVIGMFGLLLRVEDTVH